MTPQGEITGRFTVNPRGEDDMIADIAFDGARYLVAYNDSREGPAKVYYTLVEPDGTVMDDSGARVAGQESLAIQENPAVAFGGGNYLVAWLGSRPLGNVVLGVRVGADGGQVDSLPVELSPDSLLIEWVTVASDGENFLVAWTSHAAGGPGSDLFFRRLSSAGQMLDSLPVLVHHSDEYLCEPSLAFLGDRFLLAWTETGGGDQDVRACRILRDGTILDQAGFDVASGLGTQRQPDIASDSARFFVVWSDNSRSDFDVIAPFVDTAGTVGVATAEQCPTPDASRLTPTLFIARNILFLHQSLFANRQSLFALLDAAGRKALTLHPGANDVSRLAPGVYFVAGPRNPARKVVLQH